jgi:hypothetical protein
MDGSKFASTSVASIRAFHKSFGYRSDAPNALFPPRDVSGRLL